nr:hypothetical protein [Tanacetum cinerariifolium]
MSSPVTTDPKPNSDPSHHRPSLSKRKKSKPIRFEVSSPSDAQKQTQSSSPAKKIKKLKI